MRPACGKACADRSGQRGWSLLGDGAVSAEAVATAVVEAMREERCLVLPHPDVLSFLQRKTADYDRWLRGMRRLPEKVMGTVSERG